MEPIASESCPQGSQHSGLFCRTCLSSRTHWRAKSDSKVPECSEARASYASSFRTAVLVCLEQELHPTIYEEIHQFLSFPPKSCTKKSPGSKKEVDYSLFLFNCRFLWRLESFRRDCRESSWPKLFLLSNTRGGNLRNLSLQSYELRIESSRKGPAKRDARRTHNQWDCGMVWRWVRRQRWWGNKWKQSDRNCFSIEILRTTCTISYRCTRMSCTQEICMEVLWTWTLC